MAHGCAILQMLSLAGGRQEFHTGGVRGMRFA